MPRIEAVIEGRYRSGNRNRTMTEITYGPNLTVVWPVQHTYVVLNNPQVYYTSGYSAIAANGSSSRAFVSAQVQEYAGSTPIGSPYNQVLEVRELIGNVKDEYVINGQTVALDRFYVDSEGAVCGNNLMDHPVPNGYSISVRCGLGSQNYIVTVNQQANTSRQTDTQKVYDGYTMTIDNNTFGPTGGTATLGGIASFTTAPIYTWTSGATSVGASTPGTESVNPTNIYASRDPMSAPYPTISGMNITFQPNTLGVNITYTISGQAYLDGVSYPSNVKAYVQETAYTYSDMVIQSYGYADIPAGGGSVYPGIVFKLKCYENGTLLGEATGSAANGDTVAYASIPNVLDVAVDVTYYVGSTQDTSNGRVYADSKGITPSGRTSVKSNLKVTLSKGGASATSGTVTVYQGKNEVVRTVPGSMSIQSFSISANPASIDTAAPTTVVVQGVATGSGTTTKKIYTSGAEEGGATISLNNTPVVPTSLKVNNVTQQYTTQFTADNRYTLSPKTYSVVAGYEGASASISVSQVADAKVEGTSVYHATLEQIGISSIWAGGGSVLLRASAWHVSGTVWASDGTAVPDESTTTYDIGTVELALTQSGNFYSVSEEGFDSTTKTFRLTHRDMENNVGTDGVTVAAVNGTASSTTLSYSVSNAVDTSQTYTEYGPVSYGADYIERRNYNVAFSIADYKSDTSPAPFYGNPSTTYNVQGYHQEATFHDGTREVYQYQRYTSWSQDHDDTSHKYLVSQTTDTTTYYHQQVSDWGTAWGDSCSVATGASWLTIDTTHKTITFDNQTEPMARPRSFGVVATNTDDPSSPKASVTIVVYQQAYQVLSASPSTHDFEWDDTQSAIIDVAAWYVQFKVSVMGGWVGVSISPDGVSPYVGVDAATKYGSVTAGTTAKLKVTPLSPNYDSTQRIGQITLIPQDTSGVSQVLIRLSQDEYGGGAPTNE